MSYYPAGVTIRPLTRPGGTPSHRRSYSPFSAGWTSTLNLLSTELRHLKAKQPVLELDYFEGDLRLDGLPRANARAKSPAVALSFESKHGPLRYSADRYYTWQENVRAIALGLEALRKVDRYGIGTSGEQYRGWKAISNSAEDPRDILRRHARVAADEADALTNEVLFKAAIKTVHPDVGGSVEAYSQVMEARRSLEGSGRWPA